MFISEKIVFIELQKTGSTHIRTLLSYLLEGQRIGKHNLPTPEIFTSQRSFLGSVRDPWEWYVSLWAFGCDQKGGFYNSLTRPKKKALVGNLVGKWKCYNWKRSYSNVHDASCFRDWLYMMHHKRYWNDFSEGYGLSPIKELAGFLTYRYLKLFCQKDFSTITSINDLKDFEKNNCYIDYFISNENLEEDLITVLRLCGIEISETQKDRIYSYKKTNTSSRKEKSSFYYDNDTIALVQDREKLIIDKFGYTPPII